MRLQGKVAIITGGSRGIGRATAEAFLREGAIVAITASNQANADKAAANLREAFPGSDVMGISPNLTQLEDVRKAFAQVLEKFGRVDILVNNAGASDSTPFLITTTRSGRCMKPTLHSSPTPSARART